MLKLEIKQRKIDDSRRRDQEFLLSMAELLKSQMENLLGNESHTSFAGENKSSIQYSTSSPFNRSYHYKLTSELSSKDQYQWK